MAVTETTESMARFRPLPFAEQGVWKFRPSDETGPIHLVWINYLNQLQVDDIKKSYDAHELLACNGQPRDEIAVRVFVNSYIPTPSEFVDNPDFSLNSIIRSSRNAKIIESGIDKNHAARHLLTMEFTRRIIALEQFDDGRNVPTLLKR